MKNLTQHVFSKRLYKSALLLFMLFYIFTVAIRPITVFADDGNPFVPTTDQLNTGLTAQIGGDTLSTASQDIAQLTDITGAYYDSNLKRIVFIGTTNGTLHYNKDDMAVAIKSIMFNNTMPDVNIGDDPNNPTGSTALVSYTGTIQNTNLGSVLFNSDYKFKQYAIGYDPTNTKITSTVPTYKSVVDRYVALNPTLVNGNESKFILSPLTATLKNATSSSAFVFSNLSMQATAQQVNPGNDPLWNQAAQNFATDMTSNYDQYAQESTSLAQAKQIAKIVAILKWVSDNNITTDFNWARNYTTQTASTPGTVQKVTTPVLNGYSAQGEVTFTTPNSYIPDDGTAAALKGASQAVSGSQEDVTWNFSSGGTQYQAVAVAAGAFKSLGAQSTSASDFSTPVSGDLTVSFKRSYNSFSSGQSGIGIGWDFMPARIYPNAAVSTDITTCNSINYFTKIAIDTANGHETFTFSCPGGYSPDDPSFHSKVVQNADGSADVTLKDQAKYKFDTFFDLAQILDKNNNALNFSYSTQSGNLTGIGDTHGHSLTISYNAQNLISQVADWAGNVVKYFYDGAGNLTSVIDTNGNTTIYTYDSNNRLATITDRNGQLALTNTYASDNRIATSKNAANLLTTYTYDNVNRVITLTDSNGRVVKTNYDTKARILQQTDPAVKNIIYTYGNEVLPLTYKDKNNNQYTFTYDSNGNMLSAALPDTSTINYTYDTNNRLTKILDGRYGTPAKELDYAYDVNGNQTQKTEAGLITNYTYNSAGDMLTTTDPLNHTTTWTKDTFGNPLTQIDALNNTDTYLYDSLGRIIKSTDANNVSISYTYDANGNLLTKTDGTGTTTNVYDKEGRLKTITAGDGSVTNYAFNPTGTISSVTDPLNNITYYGYDSYKNLTSRTDELNNITTNTYDQLNRKTQTSTPLGKVSKWTYDNNGNILSRIDANNTTTTYTYDNFDRLTKITYPDTTTVTFTYDSRGNKTQMVDHVGTATYTYDNFDRLTQSIDEYGHKIIYTYDNAGNMKTLKYPDASLVTYSYDADNHMTSVLDWNNKTTSYTYNKNGTLASRTLPNGIVTNYTYDTVNKVAGITHQLSGTTLAQFNYIRDGVGNVTNAVEQGSFITPPSGSSYYAEYYDNQTLSGNPKLTRLDSSINFNWGTGSPDPSIPADHFSARWTKSASFNAGSYKFTSTSDDGSRLYIDGELIYDNWAGSGSTSFNVTKDFTAGTHIVEYEYQENTGSAQASLSYTQVSNPYAAQYFSNQTLTGTPALTRNDTAINFNWGAGSPGTGIPSDHFSARWTRTDNLANGNYTFTVTADDGVRLYIDNALVLDKWVNVASATTYTVSQNLTAGSHIIKMEYYENTGNAVANLSYQQTGFSAQYYNNQTLSGSPTLTRQENSINNTWGTGSPDPSIPSDHFSARWTKTQNFAGGTYQFSTTTDDGARLYIDNNLVIDKWVDQNATWTTIQKLSSGTHTIKMEYYEDTSTATAKLQYQQIAPQNITTFSYDADGRLIKALYSNNNLYSYTYDKLGNVLNTNIINDPNNGTHNDTLVYDADSKLTNINGYTTFNYDNNGNMLEKPSQGPNPDTYNTFDFENKLTQYYNANTTNRYFYTYDGLGNRLRTDFSTTITKFITDMSGDMPRTLALTQGPSTDPTYVSEKFLYGVGLISDDGSSYYLEDGLGNLRFMTNGSGGNSGSASYDPFGNQRSFSSLTSNFNYKQQWLDSETGNYYMRARFYDPSLYRFISQDPMDGNATQPLSQNHYTYSYDNPINLSDPSGLAVDPNAANNCVYVCMVNGKINYVGITNDVGRRTLQWLKQGRSLTSIPSLKNLTRIQARSLEQYLIEKFGQAKSVNPATKLLNKINSIGANSPKYQAAKQWATEFFESHPDIEEDITALEGAL